MQLYQMLQQTFVSSLIFLLQALEIWNDCLTIWVLPTGSAILMCFSQLLQFFVLKFLPVHVYLKSPGVAVTNLDQYLLDSFWSQEHVDDIFMELHIVRLMTLFKQHEQLQR
jgi:hypothetical protein